MHPPTWSRLLVIITEKAPFGGASYFRSCCQKGSDAGYIRCLEPFRTLYDLELYRITLGKGLEPSPLMAEKMNENIVAIFLLEEPETLAVVEPFHSAVVIPSLLVPRLFDTPAWSPVVVSLPLDPC